MRRIEALLVLGGLVGLVLAILLVLLIFNPLAKEPEGVLPTRYILPEITELPTSDAITKTAPVIQDITTPEGTVSTATPPSWHIINPDPVNVYSCPDRDCAVLQVLNFGDEVQIVDTTDGWHEILLEGDEKGYVLDGMTSLTVVQADDFTPVGTVSTDTPLSTGKVPTSEPPPGQPDEVGTVVPNRPPDMISPPPGMPDSTVTPNPDDPGPEPSIGTPTDPDIDDPPQDESSPPN